MKSLSVFILAAGLGERLRPLTTEIPKPLLPVMGKPILGRLLDRLSGMAVNKIALNLHYYPDLIKQWIAVSDYSGLVDLFFEEEILGTGGALKNAEDFLKDSVFLVHNADILSDIDLPKLVETHMRSGNEVTMAVHDCKEFNNVWIDNEGRLKFIGKEPPSGMKGVHAVAFTGIAVYAPTFLKYLPQGRSGIIESWMKAVSEGAIVGSRDVTGCSWTDMGTPQSYAELVFSTLKEEGELIYVDPSFNSPQVNLGAYTVIEEKCNFLGSATLRHCILLPGATIPDCSLIEHSIVGPDYLVPINNSLSIPQSLSSSLLSGFFERPDTKVEMSLIGTGGSERKYYRVREKEKTAVLMECPGSDPDFQKHLIYTEFFRKWSFPVPELLGSDIGSTNPMMRKPSHFYALFEDLGDVSLYSWLKFRKGAPERLSLYRSVLDIMIDLHTTVTAQISGCLLLKSRVFDYEHLLWESSYFLDKFIAGLAGMEADPQSVRNDFERLAKNVDALCKVIIHRDFQSQNIMITRGDVPRVIDYQGARMGPPGYDLASFLWDPYALLDNDMRSELVEYYIQNIGERDVSFREELFRKGLLWCRLQRHMQALGAYGCLAKDKRKKYFLKYIPQALRYLKEEASIVSDEYPALSELIENINEETRYRL